MYSNVEVWYFTNTNCIFHGKVKPILMSWTDLKEIGTAYVKLNSKIFLLMSFVNVFFEFSKKTFFFVFFEFFVNVFFEFSKE